MAAVQAHQRYEGARSGWLVVAAAMLALAIGGGHAVAMGEVAGLLVGLSLVGAVAVLFDFRVGAVLLLVLLPVSTSSLFPHGMLGITGLNPLNVVLLATLGSFVLHERLETARALLPWQLVCCYIPPIVLAGVIGMSKIQFIPSFFYELGAVDYITARQYLLLTVVKPLMTIPLVLMIGAAAARSRKPEGLIVAIAVSAWLIVLIQMGFVLMQGMPLAAMASPDERSFYEPIGIHANELGRIYLYALALLLFVWAETKQPGRRLFLLVTVAAVALGLLLTFSRAAIGAAGVVGALFLMWKFNARRLGLSLLAVMLIGMLLGPVLYARLTLGVGESADAVSAGRIGIWLPLLPEVLKHPFFGNGSSAILWSFPMQMEAMMAVTHAHNAYLETTLNMGLIGLALMLFYYAHVWKGFRQLGGNAWLSAEMRGFFQGATAALVAFFVTGLVGSTLTPSADSAYLWIAIGLMYGMLARRPAR